MNAGLYCCLDDSIWEVTCISFRPTVFGNFSVVVDIKNHFTSRIRRLDFKAGNYESVFEKFKPLSYFKDRYPEHFL